MSMHTFQRIVFATLIAAAALLSRASVGDATEVGGGGSSKVDCLTTFEAAVNQPATKPRSIRCADGAPCDMDGIVNGQCNFQVAVCANSTFNPSACTLNGVRLITVEHSADNGDPKFDPEFQALQTRINSDINALPNNPNEDPDTCTNATNFFVSIKGPFKDDKCKKNKKQIRLVTESKVTMGTIYVDKDKIDLVCEPPVGGCDPGTLYTSTYDRVQRQIFNETCAVSGCHDSNAFNNAGNLLLEASAFPGNLINRTPTNAEAAALGWKRIVPGDSGTSYILHKLNGDFPPGEFGDRMPKDRPKLDATLINVIKLWIEAGAPDSGWVPGTD
jgi:hypothetical protein